MEKTNNKLAGMRAQAESRKSSQVKQSDVVCSRLAGSDHDANARGC